MILYTKAPPTTTNTISTLQNERAHKIIHFHMTSYNNLFINLRLPHIISCIVTEGLFHLLLKNLLLLIFLHMQLLF